MSGLVIDGIEIHRGPLYKYKSLQGDNLAHTLEILGGSRIYCPSPNELNDPLECKPKMWIGDIADPDYWPLVEAWARRCITHREPQPTEEQISAELSGLTQERLNALAAETSGEYQAEINRQFRILSMAVAHDNGHLWNAYADEYAGVCIKFDFNPHFATAYRVKYSDTVPLLELPDDQSLAAMDMTALRKRTSWEVEGEARLILREPPIDGDPHLIGKRLYFQPARLKAVLLGYRINREHRQIICNVLKGRGIPLYEATGGAPFARFAVEKLGVL